MIALPYLLTLDQPLLATDPGGEPNSSVSRSYIPGGLLRGLLAGRYLQRFQPADPSADPIFRRLFLDGSTCFLHAYPAGEHAVRMLPTPRSLLINKGYAPTVHSSIPCYDEAHPELDDQDERTKAEAAGELKPLGALFIEERAQSITPYNPSMTVSIHIQRYRPSGRAQTALGDQRRGEVFRYEALAAGQQFGGAILVDPSDETLVRDLLGSGTAQIGRSRSAGYGRVTIAPQAPRASWRELPEPVTPISAGGGALLWLLSDTILEDPYGQPLRQLDASMLTELLGVSAKLLDSFTAMTLIGGFNGAWRLPLRQSAALAAGSVLRIQLPEGLSAKQIQQIEERGLGLRRAEGYGRVAIRPQRDQHVLSIVLSGTQGTHQKPALSSLSTELAQSLVDRRLAQRIEQRLAEFAHTYGIEPPKRDREISPAQLARIATMARQALPGGNVEEVSQLFADQRSHARDQFDAVRLNGGQRLSDWISELLTRPEEVWPMLNLRAGEQIQGLAVAGQAPHVDAMLTHRTALRLIIAVLAAERERQRRKQKGAAR